MAITPKFVWNPDYMSGLANDLGDGRIMLCLSPLTFRMVADMSQMLLWHTRYGVDPLEEIPDFGKVAYEELNTIMCFPDYSNELALLANAIESLSVNQTVNVSGGCSGTAVPTTLYCYGVDGLPVITPQPLPPTEPTPPPGTTLPLDPVNGPLPDGYTDWTEYDSMACLAANMLWWWTHGFLRIIETMIDGIAVLAVAITLIIPLLPAGIIAAIGGATILEIIWQLVQIVTSEQATDIINEITDWMEAERDEIVCYIFQNRYDFGLSQGLVLAEMAGDYVQLTVAMSPEERNRAQNMVANLFSMTLFWGMIAEKLTTLATGTTWETEFPAIDCALCGVPLPSGNYVLLPVPGSLMTLTGNDWVTQTVSGYVVTMSKPTLHYGNGDAKFTFTEVAAYHSIVGATPKGWVTRIDNASHIGYPDIGPYEVKLDPLVNQIGEVGLSSISTLNAEIALIDGGAFLAAFDHTTFPGVPLPIEPNTHINVLNHDNDPYSGTVDYRIWALFRTA